MHRAATELNRILAGRTVHGGFPLVSCFTNDCLARRLDYDRGGARYNWVENSLVGLANLTDSLSRCATSYMRHRGANALSWDPFCGLILRATSRCGSASSTVSPNMAMTTAGI